MALIMRYHQPGLRHAPTYSVGVSSFCRLERGQGLTQGNQKSVTIFPIRQLGKAVCDSAEGRRVAVPKRSQGTSPWRQIRGEAGAQIGDQGRAIVLAKFVPERWHIPQVELERSLDPLIEQPD